MKYHKLLVMQFFLTSIFLIIGGIIQNLNTPLTTTTCFNGYTDCKNELRNNQYPVIPYTIIGISLIAIMFVCLRYNRQNYINMEVDR